MTWLMTSCIFYIQGLKQQEEEQNFQREFPPCNMEYKPSKGTRFWCTTQSGGIERDWVRFLFKHNLIIDKNNFFV